MANTTGKKFGRRKKGTPNKSTSEIQALAQEYGSEAIATLVNLMRQSEDRKVQFAAVREVLSRGYGPPKDVREVVENGDGTINEAQVIAFLDALKEQGDPALAMARQLMEEHLNLRRTVNFQVVGQGCLRCGAESPEGQPILLPIDE